MFLAPAPRPASGFHQLGWPELHAVQPAAAVNQDVQRNLPDTMALREPVREISG